MWKHVLCINVLNTKKSNIEWIATCQVTSVVSYSLRPYGLQGPIGFSVHGFSRQEYWSILPCHSPEDLPDPGIEPGCLSLLHWQAASLPLVPPGKPLNECIHVNTFKHEFLWSQLATISFFSLSFELPYFLYETLSSKFGLFCC